MRYTIYKVTNLLSGKFYIGKHQTLDPNDRYFGSGKVLLSAIKRHGKNNFTKEILFDFDSEAEMNEKERELVTEDLVANPICYNMAIGGEGGPHFKGHVHSEETRAKIREQRKNQVTSDETRAKLSAVRHTDERKQKVSEFAKKRVWSDETRKKISESLKKRYENSPRPQEVKDKISETMKTNHRYMK